jgi:hypothetical protein
MNRIEKMFSGTNEAEVRFLDGEFQIVKTGDFVRCAVSGKKIALPDLRYWSVELQEAYASADISLQRHLETHPCDDTPST